MTMHHLGHTRSRRELDHLLQTPDTFVWAPLPGMTNATACVHAAPALGAGFLQYTTLLGAKGEFGVTPHSRFVYVLEGSLMLSQQGAPTTLHASSFAYLPPRSTHTIASGELGARVVVIEKPYVPLLANQLPPVVVGIEHDIAGTALMGDDAVQVRTLLPADALYDFAVNTMEYQPGASLPMVESHVMEHGLLMLEGEGIYRLGDAWYPVAKGDFIWMAPFCPQWFAAIGKTPARYLIYKNWNRNPLAEVSPR